MVLKVAITGATGFIGAAILRQLLQAGFPVAVLLRPASDTARLEGVGNFEKFTYSTLEDPAMVAALSHFQPDIFIHCAWKGVGGQDRNEEFQITENLPSVLGAVQLASQAGCRQWIGLGSQAEYGNLNCTLDEGAPLRPTTIYGKAKLAAGVAALALCDAHGLAGAWVRVFSTYGPNDSPSWFIPYVIREFLAGRSPRLTKCEQLWDYLYVTDAACAVVSLANGDSRGFFNLGSGSALPLKNYIEAIRASLASPLEPIYGALPYRVDQVMHLEADISRLVRTTNWRPAISFVEGINNTIEFEKQRFVAKLKF
jgi:UDP-glucose 4-epimerase